MLNTKVSARRPSLFFIAYSLFLIFFNSCSIQKEIARSVKEDVLETKALQSAHVGISIFDPAENKYLYNYQGDKYFVPASNTKLPTCYAAMKYLGDSLVGARVIIDEQARLLVFPSGDPSFLNSEFTYQPVFQKMKQSKTILVYSDAWKEDRWGSGWSWNDYDAAYMAERSPFPVYGNVVQFYLSGDTLKSIPGATIMGAHQSLGYDKNLGTITVKRFSIGRGMDDDAFVINPSSALFSRTSIPLRTDKSLVSAFLEDTLKAEVIPASDDHGSVINKEKIIIRSQPTDSLLKPMMHRSDNFFAEQALLMVSNERLGIMNDARIIDTLLKTDFKDLPQKPRWADGSGLSRYNLFTPQDFVAILNKMKNEFGMERIKNILATGGEGTISSYYKADSGYIYGKTGTLSGVVAFSGFLYTKKGKLLLFSTLVNNHQASATEVRRAVEKFLEGIRNKY
jgi:D-alanyl-D-alanine carboxypeptidase/D-alanyl-D-alanine-endopeptidase (penicillin-binding protein 4)